MAHFALIEDGIIQQVIVVSDDDAPGSFPDSEAAGQSFIASLGLAGEWRQTSYNGSFRGKYAGIGDVFDGADFKPLPADASAADAYARGKADGVAEALLTFQPEQLK